MGHDIDFPGVAPGLFERIDSSDPADAGVAAKQVDGTQLGLGLVYKGGDGRSVGDVERVSEPSDLAGNGRGRCFVYVGHNDRTGLLGGKASAQRGTPIPFPPPVTTVIRP